MCVLPIEKPKILYHAIPVSYYKKVSKYGLSPDVSNVLFDFPNKLFLTDKIERLYDFIKQKGRFYILRVGVSEIRIFQNPNLLNDFCTLETVWAFYSSHKIKEIKTNDRGDVISFKDID